ncbi:glycosyltransferase [Pseudarthrobacter enclensis]|uniref:glycosyltransferase n=1 Tax=Pseudarthrobacter enclensis TaxID=993070 RepID=UPI003EE0DAFA
MAAVVVHHKSYESVGQVVANLLQQGISAANLLVVDNSEELGRRDELRSGINSGVEVKFTRNRGYGAAVNDAIRHFKSREESPDFFLVSTHEARPAAAAIQLLVDALLASPSAAVAGPTLISGVGEEFVWSTGGYLDPLTGIPAHHNHRAPLEVLGSYNSQLVREWLDGAFLLYRWEDIQCNAVSEEYFLYMEETDLHLRLRRLGREAIWVPKSRVWQDSNGIPPFFFARNIRLFLRSHGGLARSIVVPPIVVVRRALVDIIRGRGPKPVLGYLKGLFTPLHQSSKHGEVGGLGHVYVINPLGAALHHYENEMISVLSAADVDVSTRHFEEPSSSGKKPHEWVFAYVSALLTVRRERQSSSSRILVLWPVLGYLDIVLFWFFGLKNISIVMHDPQPLVRSLGYSRSSRLIAGKFGGGTEVIAHSQKAFKIIHDELPGLNVKLLPHPILPPIPAAATQESGVPIVRVLGQYKNDRDIKALVELGRELASSTKLEIHGRGWPAVKGWEVIEGFVSEQRFDELMKGSSVVLIPYRRFFQSGIAIRALENGTPFVGPRQSVLAEMMGEESSLLIDADSPSTWISAVRYAIEHGHGAAHLAATSWRNRSVSSWANWGRESA